MRQMENVDAKENTIGREEVSLGERKLLIETILLVEKLQHWKKDQLHYNVTFEVPQNLPVDQFLWALR